MLNGAQQKPVPSINGLYNSVFYHWDGTTIKAFKDGVISGTDVGYSTPLISRPNVQLGARSNAADGSVYSFFFDGDIAAVAVFNDSDYETINELWSKIAAPYLALNP